MFNKFTNKSAIIFKENYIYSAMLKAATISKEEYQEINATFKNHQENIYNISLNKLKKNLLLIRTIKYKLRIIFN